MSLGSLDRFACKLAPDRLRFPMSWGSLARFACMPGRDRLRPELFDISPEKLGSSDRNMSLQELWRSSDQCM
jgi:hypothetical protein